MRTNQSWSNYVLLLLLVTAFLSMQWTAVHIHLAEQHDHDGTDHQHQLEAHAHNLSIQDVAVIDSSHQENHSNVLDFSYDYSVPKVEKQKTPSAVVSTHVPVTSQLFLRARIEISDLINTKSSYFSRSTDNPRAPPRLS
jgi:hypothetical protein